MHYGDPVIRKSVPLALGLVSASNPQLPILDILSKYSHDNDIAVALNAIFAMGLVGAGTNNARLAQMLRQLAGYYHKEPDCLFMVRIAQGLVHMGKGTIGINPFYLDRTILNKPAVAGLLATLTAFTDAKACKCSNIIFDNGLTLSSPVILDKYHWMLYFLVPAMYPRFLITLDEGLEPKPVTVRVGTVSTRTQVLFFALIPAFRLSTSWVRRGNRAQSLGSRPIRHPYDWQPPNVRSLQRKNTFRSQVCWKGSFCCKRTQAGKRKWSCRLYRCGTWPQCIFTTPNSHASCNRW